MGLFRRALTRVREWFSDEPRSPPPPPEEPTPGRPPEEPPSAPPEFIKPAQDLPPGWKFEGLYYSQRDPANRRVISHDPTDGEVATADSIIISYTDGLGTIYRTIHGANSRKDVGKLIMRVTQVVSPR